MCSLPAHLCSAVGHFLSCLGQPGLLATFSFLERGHLPSGRPVSTHLVLLFKRQQLAQESAPRSLSLKLAGVIRGPPLLSSFDSIHFPRWHAAEHRAEIGSALRWPAPLLRASGGNCDNSFFNGHLYSLLETYYEPFYVCV